MEDGGCRRNRKLNGLAAEGLILSLSTD